MSVTFIKNFCSFANQNGGGGFFLQRLGKFQFLHHQHSVCFFVLLLFFLKISSLFCVFKKSRQFACNLFFLHIMQTLVVGTYHHHSFGDMSMFSGEVAAEVILTSSGTVVVVGTAAATAAFKGGGSILPFPV